MKEVITIAARTVLLRDGLQSWSVDRVAAEAQCAKGLVSYHHGTKRALLATVAGSLSRDRQARRMEALRGSGAEALDQLWQVLVAEVHSGEWAASAALLAEPGIETHPESQTDLDDLAAAIGSALEVPALRPDATRLAVAALYGLQCSLQMGAPEDAVHEAYHRLWLTFLP